MEPKKRLVDAERFKRILQNTERHLKGFGQHKKTELIESIIKNLDLQPTVDAVEVVHGRWEKEEPDKCGNRKPKCSVCGKYHLAWWSDYTHCNYCPNCGAKMDGGAEA